MASRGELFDRLKCLSPAQFEEVLFRLEIEPWIIPGAFAEQSVRAKAVIQRLEQEQEGLVRLERTLVEPAISIIGEQYIGYEIEAQVKRIVSEYTQQPFEGREEEKCQLDEFVMNNASGVLLVMAAAGFGKSALLSHWQQRRQEDCFIAYHCFSYRYEKTRLVSEAYRHLLKQLYLYYNIRNGQLPNDENRMRDILIGMLREPISPEGKRLVIVLDGLDEAEKTFEPFFTLLPAGVFVIASARAEAGDEPEYLRNWTDNAQRLHLKRLPREAIAKWLEQIKELAAYSEDNEFVKSLNETTGGFPLYLRFLIDDLKQAATQSQNVQAVVRNSPGGFKAYVKEQFRQLAKVEEIKQQREVQELFALLSVALGALSEDDIEDLTSLSAWDLADLPWQATRWFSIQMGVYSFAHPLLADEFQGVLGRQADSAQGKLIEYCAKWQEHHSAYALRHYAEHLGKAKRWEELYAIALNRDFASTQRQQLPDEPDLSLKTVRTALLGAAEEDNAEKMAEFLLVHAHRLGQTNAQESPLEALRSGSLKRAWKLADQFEIERCILWYLLLAWELKDEGKLDEARETLERLKEEELPRFPNNPYNWQSDYSAHFLAYIFNINKENFTILVQQILDNYHQISWINYVNKHKIAKENKNQIRQQNELWTRAFGYAETENFYALLETTAKGIDGLEQIEVLGFIAKGLASEGKTQKARSIFATAFQIKQGVEPTFSQALALADVAVEQVKFENEVGANTARIAHQIAQRINDTTEQAIALALIAEVMAKADKHEEAKIIFDRASEIAQTIQIQQKRVNSFITIAKAQVRTKKYTDARKSVKLIEYPENEAEVLGVIAKAQAEDGKLEESQITLTTAFEIAEGRYQKWERVNILCTIAEVQAVKDKKAAQLTLERARREGTKYLWKIAEAQAKIGEIPNAIQLLNEIEDQWEQVIVLFCIAWTQFNKGEKVSTLDAAIDAKDKIEDEEKLERTLKVIARIQAWAGKSELAVRTAERFLTERNRYLPKVAEVLTDTGDRENFKRLLSPCAYYLDAAYQMCGLLAKLYPDKAADIVNVVK